jgi:hypothetical protein
MEYNVEKENAGYANILPTGEPRELLNCFHDLIECGMEYEEVVSCHQIHLIKSMTDAAMYQRWLGLMAFGAFS